MRFALFQRRVTVSLATVLLCATGSAQTASGIWQGKMDTPNHFRIVFRIDSPASAPLHGVLYQPDQSNEGIVLSSVTFASGQLDIAQRAMDLAYRGKMAEDGTRIDGTLTRDGKAYTLNLERTKPEDMWKHDASPTLAAMATSPDMAFDVATIKPSRPDTPRSIKTRARIFTSSGTTVENLITFAWSLRAPRIDGLPDWAKAEKFDITAEPNADGQPSEDQDKEMLKKLLGERFGLKFHMTQKDFPVLALTLDATHVVMTPSDKEFWQGSIYVKDMPGGDTEVQFVGQSMAMFADTLMNFIRERQIVDETGLGGHFDFTLKVNAADLKNPSEDVRGDAVRRAAKDAGFRLTQKHVPLSVMVVDMVVRPTAN